MSKRREKFSEFSNVLSAIWRIGKKKEENCPKKIPKYFSSVCAKTMRRSFKGWSFQLCRKIVPNVVCKNYHWLKHSLTETFTRISRTEYTFPHSSKLARLSSLLTNETKKEFPFINTIVMFDETLTNAVSSGLMF